MAGDIVTTLKVAGLAAGWAVVYAALFYAKAWQSGKERWSWAKFWTTVFLAGVLGFGASLMNVTPDEFWAMIKDSVLGTFAMVMVENGGKLAGRAMRGVPPEGVKLPRKGDKPPADPKPEPGGDGGGDGRAGGDGGEDPDRIVEDALKPLKPEL